MKNTALKILLVLLLISTALAYFAFDLQRFFNFAFLQQSQRDLANLFAQNPVGLAASYFAVYVLIAALSLPGAVILTLAGGAVFGLLWGTVIVSFASSIGATLSMLAARYLLGEQVQARFADRLQQINHGMDKDGAFYLFTLRLIPAIPFFVVNALMGLTKIKVSTFYVVSQLGMLAGTLVYVNAGTQLAQIQGLRDVLSPLLIGSLVLLGLFPWLVRKLLQIVRKV